MTIPVDVSVVMPVYDGEAFVERAVRSVLAQDAALGSICVDDGSSDHSADVTSAIGDPRIRLLRQPNSGRPAVPLNLGIARRSDGMPGLQA